VVFSKATAEIDKVVVDRTHDVARERGLPAAQIAMAWLLSKPAVTSPIVGATKPHHLDDALAALSVKLSDDEVKRLEEVYQPRPATAAYS
jgi:aryl-alcohol dehydrogenase-like predicted oxidoreductase